MKTRLGRYRRSTSATASVGGPPYIQAAVTKIKRLSNDGVQNASRFLCLLGTSLDRAAGGPFASRQVDNAGLVSEMGELEERPSHRQLYIVRVRSKRQHIEGHKEKQDAMKPGPSGPQGKGR